MNIILKTHLKKILLFCVVLLSIFFLNPLSVFAQDKVIDLPEVNVIAKKLNKNQESNVTITSKANAVNTSCLTDGGKSCGFSVNQIFQRSDIGNSNSVEFFVQDIVLSTTMFFGTIFAIIILFSGFLYILSAIEGSDSLQSRAKKGITNGIVGLLLVSGSFAIVRFIQFLAAGGS